MRFTDIERGPAPLKERARYLRIFIEHAALVAALRAVSPPELHGSSDGRQLQVAFLAPFPRSHRAVTERFTRWLPHLEPLGCESEIFTASTYSQFVEYENMVPGSDTRYYHECVRDQWRNIRDAAKADVIVLHRGVFPFSPWQRPTFERLLARLNPNLVYDFYDPIWLHGQEASEHATSRLGRWLQPPDKVEDIIRLAKVVTVSNEQLADFARRHHRDVRVVPVLVEPDDYVVRHHAARSPVVLGWLGSANNIPRLLSLVPALQRLAASRDIVLRVVAPERVEIPGVRVESYTHPWSAKSEREDLAALDIGLLPLDEQSPADRGKSPLKLMQYCAAGLAVVATPVAIDFSVLKPGESFLAARNQDDWLDSMTRLVDDPALRARLGGTARKVVEKHYSFESQADRFLEVLLAAGGDPP